MLRPSEIELSQAFESLGFARVRTEGCDFASPDGRLVVEIKHGLRGKRPLHSFLMRAATMLDSGDPKRRFVLLASGSSMRADRMQEAWTTAVRTLRRDLRGRLGMIVFGGEAPLLFPPDDVALKDVTDDLFHVLKPARATARFRREASKFTVLKVLLRQWILREEPMTRAHLGDLTGLSHPTVAKALASLERFLVPTLNRSVALDRFPSDAWREYTSRLSEQRATRAYCDASGQPRSASALMKRFRKLKPENVAVSGTVAAHEWDVLFDLHGTPRLDLVVHAPRREFDLEFVTDLDPALALVEDEERPPNLVVHAVQRAGPLFIERRGLLFADPVEVLLDLHEMRLHHQGDELIERLRGAAQ